MLKMHPLQSRKESDDEILIGRPDLSNYIILPEIGVEIIEMLDGGQSIEQVEQEMEERFGEPVDVLSFAQDLVVDYQFVHTVDGETVNPSVERKDHFPWITERVGQFFFNKIAYVIYALVFLSGLGLTIWHGSLFPVYSDIFISSSVTVSLVSAFVVGWLFLFLHELAHLMAARSLGIGSRLGLSHRLVFMVAETNMSNIVTVEPKRRHRAFLAGMAWDATFFGIGVWLQFAHDLGWFALPVTVLAVIKMINVTLLMSMAFQFMFFMQTDMYYVFAALFNCNNLLANTRLYLRKFYRKHTPEEAEEWESVAMREKKVIRWYAWFCVLGFLWAVAFFALYTLRQAIEFITRTVDEMVGHAVFSAAFLDGVLLILLTLVPFGIVVWSWIRTWNTRRAERRRRAALQ
ncbi:MAG TPA: PqqD family protein [Bacilli bacterium]|nr:PqqD family protein [Bacilli bacterium]